MSVSKFVISGIALAILSGGVSPVSAGTKPHKPLHFSITGVAVDDADENGTEGANKGAEHEGSEHEGSDHENAGQAN